VSPAPCCNGRDSFTVYDETDTFFCFKCERTGTVIDLYMLATGKGIMDTLEDLAGEAGIQWDRKAIKTLDLVNRLKDRAADYYHKDLMDPKSKHAAEARRYLIQERGLSEKIIVRYKIGLATGNLVKSWGDEKPDGLKKAGLMGDKGGDYWKQGLLLFPHFCQGHVSHFSAKSLIRDKKGCNYQSRSEHRNPECFFYGQDIMDCSSEIIYVEGEFDRLQIIEKTGFESVVAINGQLSKAQIKFIGRPQYIHREHYLLFDNDKAGEKYCYKLIHEGQFQGWKIYRCEVGRRYKDIDEQLRSVPEPKQTFAGIQRDAVRYSDDAYRLEETGGYYSVWRPESKNREPRLEKVCNFIMDLRRRFIRSDGEHREVVLVNEYGERSKPYIISPENMTGIQKFKSTIMSLGNFIFEGKENDLQTMWQYLFSQGNDIRVYEDDHVGYLRTHNLWLFGNAAVKDNLLIPADEDGITWHMRNGYKASLSSSDNPSEEDRSVCLPWMDTETPESWDGFINYLDLLYQNTGTYGSWLAAAWHLACAFGREIFREEKAFPILFLYGKAQSGKNTLAQNVAGLWGLSDTDFKLLPRTTPVGLSRELAYYSEMPVIVDEYRNDMPSGNFDGFLRGVYNRVGAVKADRDSATATLQVPVRGMICLMGEHYPQDMALRQRCLCVHLQQKLRNDRILEELRRSASAISKYTLKLLLEKDRRVKPVMTDLKSIKSILEGQGQDPRTAANYAIPTAVLCSIPGIDERRDEFLHWVSNDANRDYKDKNEETWVSQFMDNLLTLKERKILPVDAMYFEPATESEKSSNNGLLGWGWLHSPRAYDIWCEQRRRAGENSWPRKALMDQLREEEWVRKDELKRFPGTNPRRTLKMEINQRFTPPNVAALFGQELNPSEIENERNN
jgi:5S rRNA maturation endonuclease (ribonuclease M5)